MSKIKLVFILIVFFLKTGLSQQNFQLLDTLTNFVKQEGYPGAMISIVKADSIIFVGGIGYANLQYHCPIIRR